MNVWEDFEIRCTDFLKHNFNDYATFTHLGESDSTVPDIKVNTKKNKTFYIEAKHSPAQCGQFVLLPNIKSQSFDYSKLNVAPLNEYSQAIIDYMNNEFEDFKETGTAGKNIEIKDGVNIFANWIIKFYKDKNVKFIITNNNILIPIENIKEFFNISAKYRIKRSGSSSVGSKYSESLKTYINENFDTTKIEVESDKMFVTSSIQLHNKRFILNGIEYMFSLRENRYEIRKLSNTFNANVIFSITLKSGKQGIDIKNFILYLIAD